MRRAARHRPRAFAAAMVALLALPALRPVPASALLSSSAAASQQISSGTLAAPRNLSATVGTCVALVSVSVDLSWNEPLDAITDGYQVLRSTNGGAYQLMATLSGRASTSYTDATTTFSTTYSYAVRSTRSSWTGPNSNTASVTTPGSTCLP